MDAWYVVFVAWPCFDLEAWHTSPIHLVKQFIHTIHDNFAGNISEIRRYGYRQLHVVLQKWTADYGDVFKYFTGRVGWVVVSHPDMVQQITGREFAHFHDRGLPVISVGGGKLKEFFNKQLLFVTGKDWEILRSSLQPVFQPKVLDQHAPEITRLAQELMGKFEKISQAGVSCNVYPQLAPYTLDVIGSTAFGVNFNAMDKGESSDIVQAAKYSFLPNLGLPPIVGLLSMVFPSLSSFILRVSALIWKDRVSQVQNGFTYIRGVAAALVKNVLDDLNQSHRYASGMPGNSGYDRGVECYHDEKPTEGSAIRNLVEAKNIMTGEQFSTIDITATMYTMIAAGYETTATITSFSLYSLARYPEIQQKAYQEAKGLQNMDTMKYDELSERLPYISAVISESMRHYPPVTPIIALKREATRGAHVGNVAIPEGARVQFNVYQIHHDERWYKDPTEFVVERFLPSSPKYEDFKPKHKYAYLPFGAGGHKCIGYRIALHEAMICLSLILQKFTVSLDESMHPKGSELCCQSALTLVPDGGIWLKFEERMIQPSGTPS